MKAAFIVQSTEFLADPTVRKYIPRATRKTLRLPNKPAPMRLAHTDLTETLRRNAFVTSAYFNQNLYTQEYSDDEFNDIDDEYEGLTIVSPQGEAELWEFCTGYNVI